MTKNFTCEFPYSMLNMTMEGDYQTCSWSKVYPKYHNSSPNSFFNSSLFIFSSHVHNNLIKSFKKDNIFIFQALFTAKKDYSTLSIIRG